MYKSHNIATRIKEIAKEQNVTIKLMLEELQLGSNTMSAMYHDRSISSESLARIADYLNVSTDTLLGRELNTQQPANSYDNLNELGKSKVSDYINDLLANPLYKK